MRRYLISFLVLIASICASSQNTSNITITSEQLRTTNLIFVEHQKFERTLPLLKTEIANLKLINNSWEKTDSVRRIQLSYYGNIIEDRNKSIEALNKSLKKKQKVITYGVAGSCVLIVLCLLLK